MRQTTTRTVCLILCLAGSGRAALVTNLGAFPGAIQSVATDVNNAGTVGGFSQHSTGIAMRPFRWTAETGLVQFDSAEGRPTAIDNSGMMIGFTGGSNAGPFTPGYRYTPPGPIQRIPNAGAAMGMNENGVIVGIGVFGQPRAYRFHTTTNSIEDLGTLGTGVQSQANDVNDFGVTVGWSHFNNTQVRRAFRQSGTGLMEDLGLPEFASEAEATAINNAGTIIIRSNFGFAKKTGNGPLISLPLFAVDINNPGFIIGGIGQVGTTLERAALYTPNNLLINLDTWLDQQAPAEGANWTLHFALGISNNGWIAGRGAYNDGPAGLPDGPRAFLLDARSFVPEPNCVALLLPPVLLLTRARASNKRPRNR